MNISVQSLETASKYLYRYGGVVLIVFGTLGCILNILVFIQKTLRKNPCSIYLATANIFNILFINSLFLTTTLESGFDININVKSLILCRLCFYTSLISNFLSTYCLILASRDRMLIASRNIFIRRHSNRQYTYAYILYGILFWMIFHCPALFFTNITYVNQNISICFYQTGFYLTFIGYYSIIKESSSSLLLIILGLRTIRNLRRSHRLRLSVQSPMISVKRSMIAYAKDRRFICMVLTDIISFSIGSSAAAIFLTYQQLTQYQEKSIEQIKFDLFLKHLAIFCLHIPFCISFYTNLLVSKAYRHAIRNLFS